MPINATAPVTVDVPRTASRFSIAHIDSSNRPDGIVVDVFWNAIAVSSEPDQAHEGQTREIEAVVKNCGPATFLGARLVEVAADAFARGKAYEAAGVTPGLAYIKGYSDAVYAALVADGYIVLS